MQESITESDFLTRDKFLSTHAESYVLHETILNSTELSVISTNKEGVINSINKVAEKTLGYKAEELVGKKTLILVHDPEELKSRAKVLSEVLGRPVAPGFEALVATVSRARPADRREWTYVRKDKSRLPVSLSVSGIWDEQGELTGFLSIAIDITEQKKAELNLRESEQKFRLLAENIPGAIYLCRNDEKFSFLYVNENIEQLTGYKAEEFIRDEVYFADLIHADDIGEVHRKVNEAVVQKRSFDLEYRIFHKGGQLRWMKEVGTGVYSNDDSSVLEGFISDVTEKKHAEAELEKIANENHRILGSTPYLQCVAGFDGYFKKLNRTWEKTLGWTLEELQSRPFAEFIHPDDIAATMETRAFIYGGSSLSSFENRYRCKDGSYRWLLWTSSTDVENKLVSASALDITSRKKSEEELLFSKTNLEVAAHELQGQNRQLNEFAHIISHNLRSPVGNIQALISLVNKNSTIQEYQEVFRNLQKTAVNLQETLNELLDILRIKKENPDERTTIRFSDVLTKATQDLMGEIIHSNATIASNFKAYPQINYSKTYLESIVLNLLSNALKYRYPGRPPEIFLETLLLDGRPILKITDNGLGIDLEKYGSQLFGLRKVFHEHKEARGVGLFLTKTQLEAMGGTIRVESTVDKGSTFFIEF